MSKSNDLNNLSLLAFFIDFIAFGSVFYQNSLVKKYLDNMLEVTREWNFKGFKLGILIGMIISSTFIFLVGKILSHNNYVKKEQVVKKTIAIVVFHLLCFGLLLVHYLIADTFIIDFTIIVLSLIFYWVALSYFFSLFSKKDITHRPPAFKNETGLLKNDYSVNLKGKSGTWLNILNPFAGTLVTGVPGMGKSYIAANEFIEQLIAKGFTGLVYDYKNELSLYAYNCLQKYKDKINHKLQFGVINFDDPLRSYRINPLSPKILKETEDCVDVAKMLYNNLNRGKADAKGQFFALSAQLLLASYIVFLRYATLKSKKEIYEGNCCTLPHLIALMSISEDKVFAILSKMKKTNIQFSIFKDAFDKKAHDQLAGQTATAKLSLLFAATPKLFWTLSGDDISTDINNPNEPKILCLINNQERAEAYSPFLGLIVNQCMRKVNVKDKLPSFLCLDECSIISMKELENLIATARSNKVATLLITQDFEMFTRDYGKDISNVLINVVGNLVTFKVKRQTARDFQNIIGQSLQERYSYSVSEKTSHTTSAQLDYIIPESKIASLGVGEIVASVVDTSEQKLKNKFFNDFILIDSKKREKLQQIKELPILADFTGKEEKIINDNYYKIIQETEDLIEQYYEEMPKDEQPVKQFFSKFNNDLKTFKK